MQVPEHVVSFYVATCGQNGPGLGSDEKEIILLVYVILEAATGQIIGTKQILVRPEGTFVKDRTTSTSSDASNNASSPPLAITYADSVNNSSCSSNNLNSTNNSINSLNITNNSSTPTSPTASNTNISSTTTNIQSSATTINNNNTIVNNNNITNGPSSFGPIETIELPVAVAQAAGKPLQEAIEEFDEYLRSLSLHDTEFKIITDGQLPLRQCLHREACVKEIGLPSYYNRFSDLRKEFSIYKSGDLSRALVPVKDIKRILQMPAAALPQSIGEIMTELNITSLDDNEFYIRESRDMVSVIQHLLKAGHKFTANETVSLVLEPGICSIDDEIDGNCIVRARGLPWQSSDQDIAKFFRGLNVAKGGVALCLSPLGRRNGEALIRFISQEHRDMALKRHKHHIGNRYIEVYRATGDDFLSVAGGASNEAQAFLSKGAQVIIRMRGLPYDCTAKQVLDFFTNGDNPCNVLDNTEGVLFVKKPDGRATGDAFVLFANEADAPKALARHRESIGQRYIELFRSTTAEVQQVLNRSLDPKTYEQNHQPPLIAQLPPMQLSLLPQHLITSGTTKNCIRLRGLPYEALVEHILHFLDDFAKHIIFQGVHMVINAQGQPSGEAFIQMDSEESARLCAQRKHHQFMVFGKKYRYIEVFQCSGDDMNMVLNGGLQSPVPAAHAHPHLGAGKQPSLLSPGMLAQQPPANAQTISPHTHAHTAHAHAHAHAHALQSPPSVAAAVAALSQPPQLTVPATAQSMALATGGISPFMTATAPQTAVQHPSLAQTAAAAAAAQNAAAAVGSLTSPPNQLSVHSSSSSAVSPQAAMTFPFNLSLPPPPTAATAAANSALIAQHQAQFIAQHNLLARQQAAAAASAAEQHQMYTNVNHLFMQQHNAAAAAAAMGQASATAAGQPQLVFMPRPYFQPFPLGYMPAQQSYQFAGVMPQQPTATATSGMHAAAAAAAVNAANAAAAASLPHSMKRSYENAFQQEANAAASAAKRVLTRPPGASVIGSPFGHFGPFPPPGPILASPHRNPHHPHGPTHAAAPHPAAFYPHPLFYWSYPSPPVSPTTYFNQPTHSPTHVPGNHGPPMYSLDYIPAVQPTNYANPATPLSPPTVGIPANTSGLILSPNKAPTITLVPTTKQYPPIVSGPAPTVAPINPSYHSKMALPAPHLPPAPTRHAHTNIFHHYSSPPTLQTAAVLPAPPPSAPAVVPTPSGGILKTPPIEQPLLAIDTSHQTVEQSALKANTKLANSSIAPCLPAVKAKSKVVTATDNANSTTSPSSSSISNINVATAIITNHCVELYTS